MILVKCISDVYESAEFSFIELARAKRLFIKGHIYMVSENERGQWMAADEEDVPHIIADGRHWISEDYWFQEHFREL